MYNGLSNYAMKTFTTTMRKDDSLFQKYRIRKADNVEMPYPKCGTSMPPPAKNKELCAIEHLERGKYEKCLLKRGARISQGLLRFHGSQKLRNDVENRKHAS